MQHLEKQVAAASGSATSNPSPSSNPLFTPFFHSLLSNRAIFKSGAELWTDALDLWACTGTGTGMQAVMNGGNTYGAEMNSCFPVTDTRILTSEGFLFYDEIVKLRSRGQQVKYAAYDSAKRQLVFVSGRLVERFLKPQEGQSESERIEQMSHELVNITHQNEAADWVDGAGDYGTSPNAADLSESNHLTLRVTTDHVLYAERGMINPSGRETLPDYHPPFVQLKAQEVLNAGEGAAWRFLAVAENGVAVPAEKAAAFEKEMLDSFGYEGELINIFLQVLGCWLSDGSISMAGESIDGVQFGNAKTSNHEFLREVSFECRVPQTVTSS